MEKNQNNGEDISIEEMFQSLDEIVHQLENTEVSLEDSFRLYHQGMDMLKNCNEKIDTVEKRIKVLDEDGKEQDFE